MPPVEVRFKQILDSEGWRVRIVSDAHMLLSELKTGNGRW